MQVEEQAGQVREVGVTAWPKVAIIILNWNGWRDTIECLESVEKSTYPNYEVVLLDNGSVDDSAERLREWVLGRPELLGGPADCNTTEVSLTFEQARVLLRAPRFTLLRSDENLGFSGGCNIAIEFAVTCAPLPELVFILNNDTVVSANCLRKCVEVCLSEQAGVVGPVVHTYDGRPSSAGCRLPLELFWAAPNTRYPVSREWWYVDGVSGAAMLLSRTLLEWRKRETGYYFDPVFFMYCEELELCVWARRRGYKIIMVRDASVRHHLTASSCGSSSALPYYYVTRNRVHVVRRYLPAYLRIAFHLWYPISRFCRAASFVTRDLSVSSAIVEGLIDGYRGKLGKWRRHPAGRTHV